MDDNDIADDDVDVDEPSPLDDGDEDLDDNEVEVLDGPLTSQAGAAPKAKATGGSASASGPVLKMFTMPSTASSAPAASGARTGSPRAPSTSHRVQTTEFMGAVTSSLDPVARKARDESRFARNLARDELHHLTQDNRDLRARNDTLQDRLHQQSLALQQSVNETTRLQARIEMLEMVSSLTGMPARGRPQDCHRDYDDIHGTPSHYRSYSRSYYREHSPSYSPEWRRPARCGRSTRPSPPSRYNDVDLFSAPGPSSRSTLPSSASGLERSPARQRRSTRPSLPSPFDEENVFSVPGPSSSSTMLSDTAPGLDVLAAVSSSSVPAPGLHERSWP